MSVPAWREEEEEVKVAGVKPGPRGKPRFSFPEVKLLLEAVKSNRYILLRKFNQGVSAETKKQTWVEITHQVNSLGVNQREVRQIMKKWADLKCDAKRRMVALRGENCTNLRKKNLSPIERMVQKILLMSPRADCDSDLDLCEDEDFSKLYGKGVAPSPPSYSYLSLTDSSHSVPGGAAYDLSPLSSPEKEPGDPFHSSSDFDLADDGERNLDFEENDDSVFSSYPSSLAPPSSTSLDPLPDNALLRMKPVHTYSRSGSQGQNHVQNHSYSRPPPGPSTSSSVFSESTSAAAAPPPSHSPTASSLPAPSSSFAPPPPPSSLSGTSHPAPSSSSIPPAPAPVSSASAASTASFSSNSHPSTSGSNPPRPPPAGASSSRDHVAQMSSQSLQQQRASRMLLTSVSQSLEALAQSVQLLVESQQEFVQESLLLQRETVDVLRDFSNTALTMLRDKANSGPLASHHHPAAHF